MDEQIEGLGFNWTCDAGDNLWRLDLTNNGTETVTADIYLDGKAAHTVDIPGKDEANWVYRVLDGTIDAHRTDVMILADGEYVASLTATDTCAAPIPAPASATTSSDSVTVGLSIVLVLAAAAAIAKGVWDSRRTTVS